MTDESEIKFVCKNKDCDELPLEIIDIERSASYDSIFLLLFCPQCGRMTKDVVEMLDIPRYHPK